MNAMGRTAAKQLVPEPAAEADAVVIGRGGQPPLVQRTVNSQKPYMRWQRNGQALDAHGNPAPTDSPAARISAEDSEYEP